MKSLEQRMSSLEKQVRISRIIIVMLSGTICTFFITGFKDKQQVPEVIQAKKFEVVDNSGAVLVRLNAIDGQGNFTSYSTTGKALVKLFSSTGGGGAINTFDTDGEINFKVTRTTEGGGYMALFNGNRKEVFETGCTDKNTGYLQLNDNEGEKLVWMTYTQDGGGYMSLQNRYNNNNITFSTPDAGGRIGIYNGSKTRICFLGTQDNKDGNLTLYNAGGTSTTSLP